MADRLTRDTFSTVLQFLANRSATLSAVEVASLARNSRIKAPVFAGIGFIDTTCPPAGIWTALNQIPGPKEAFPMIESDHNHITPEKQLGFHAREKEVLDLLLHGGTYKPNEEFTRK